MSRLKTSNQLTAVAASSNCKGNASTFRSYVARHLYFVANDKKGPSLLHRIFLGESRSVFLEEDCISKFVDFIF